MGISRVLPDALRKEIIRDNWPRRRRWMVIWTTLFGLNMQWIVVDTIFYGGNNLTIQIFITLAAAVVSVLFFYVFGAVWDDTSKRRAMGGFHSWEDRNSENESDEEDNVQESPPVPGDKDEDPIPGAPAEIVSRRAGPGIPGPKNNAG